MKAGNTHERIQIAPGVVFSATVFTPVQLSAEVSKPIGDAIPTPVEPGLDQPLPKKSETPAPEPNKPGQGSGDPLGDTDAPPGVPDPGPSGFA